MKKEKVLIIIPKGLPLPRVKGGAIETLINDIIDENERQGKLELTVASIYDCEAEKEAKKYKSTRFIYVKKDFSYILKAVCVRFANLFGKNLNTYNEIILDKIKKEDYDKIVIEDGAFFSFKSYLKFYPKEKMILHFHHCGLSDKATDSTFSKFIGVSQFVTEKFKSSSNISNCCVLLNGIDQTKFKKNITSKERKDVRVKFGFNDNDCVCIFCGRLIEEKGILELIKAIKSIDNPQIKLMIVGSTNYGSNKDFLKKIDDEVKSSKNKIKLTGYVDNKDMYKYYKSADIGVIPSTWEDAAPLVAIEMMASGLPIIVTKTGGAPEYVSHHSIIIEKDENLVKNIANEIKIMSANQNMRKKISDSELKQSEQFNTQTFYKNFVSIIEK
jgi:glycosyltransferase involved in cell wall biosynthesis